MKKKLLFYVLTANILFFYGCTPEQNCPATTLITFRGVPISFPQTGWEIREKQPNVIFNGDLYLNSTSGNTDIAWFLERGDFPFPLQDTAAHLREREVYGITFFLREERDLTDREMAEKVKKELGLKGDFVLKTKPGRSLYHYQEGCLSIITSMLADDKGPYPQVSFCYGFKEDELFYYASTPGQQYSD